MQTRIQAPQITDLRVPSLGLREPDRGYLAIMAATADTVTASEKGAPLQLIGIIPETREQPAGRRRRE